MEKTNETMETMENEQDEIKVVVVEKEGFIKKTGKAIKKATSAVKAHPFKTTGIVVGAGTVIAGAVLVIKTVIDARNGDDETITIVTDSIEEMVDKLNDIKEQFETEGKDIPFDEVATKVISE